MHALAPFRGLTPEYKLMLFAAFVFNLGFYMLIPLLSHYLAENLLLSATLIGVVMGVRSFCQQGLFLVGGVLADKLGVKRLIIGGCFLRAVGFLLFLWADHIVVLFLAAFLTGFAGALFTPAAQAYFAHAQGISKANMFALVGVARNAGELLGPVCGLLLISMSFGLLCGVAAFPFLCFGIAFIYYLPTAKKSQKSAGLNTRDLIKTVLGNRAFLQLCAVMMGYFMLINQISFAMPIFLGQLDMPLHSVTWLLSMCALISILVQLPITALTERINKDALFISAGLTLMGSGFLVMLFEVQSQWQLYLQLGLLALFFSVATAMSLPLIMKQIANSAPPGTVSTHYGFFYLFAGFGLIIGSALAGYALDLEQQVPGLIWYLFALIGGVSALAHLYLSSPNKEEKLGRVDLS
ncbi:MFS transporter [Pseudoalteromonas neustonica]|uniref:MFS transporter n=1 Tax=Pseudoalteromonas neustonica TaxID=1840331 RepID=A0ABU9TX52_9GAMM